jgi:hypothetical protein
MHIWTPTCGPALSPVPPAGALSSAKTAQGHLSANHVRGGDLFLFFGWFRQTEWQDGKLRYKPGAPDLHLIFGWMEVGDIWRVGEGAGALPQYARNHPHAATDFGPSNTIYVSAPGASEDDGLHWRGGAFARFDARLRLTAPDAPRSVWRLPAWLDPARTTPPLTYHGRPDRWTRVEEQVTLRSVGRGQEFVLDTDHYPEALTWAEGIRAIPTA